MSEPHKPAGVIFDAAIELPPGRRAAYLLEACTDNEPLRERVEALLRAHELAGTFMDGPAVASSRETVVVRPTEQVGARIGRYKLLQQIGEGGCGVVYMAEQEEPVRRRVALKVIKLGMDTKSVIARFEAERQALALMDHPNIAKVLDAGATETGRPYFVMELVRGIKITDYCDENNLSTVTRLGLFVQVCQAIQHAHQKGIIHRDIKPSNILVADNDGVPVPKVIDFGIAKATTDQRLTDKTLFTAFEQFIGTPAYMSPEQAKLSGLDIDTRSDIYSLGVLLYELLTATTPFETKRLHEMGLDEIRRTIREEEPLRPSTRLQTLDASEQTTVARHRQSEPPKLGDGAFESCSLTSVTIGNSVTSIGNDAFEDCASLTSVTIPNSVTNIGDLAFASLGLTNIAVNAANPYYAGVGGVLFNKSLDTLLQFPGGLAGSYAIPNSVTNIGDAFEGCGLTSVTIPNSVTSIGENAFGGSLLTSVIIPNSVTNIDEDAFAFCYGLTNITFSGNAPLVHGVAGSADSTVFQGNSGTVYYYAGTSGWGSTYGGLPTVELFAPQIGGGGIGIQSGNFGFTVTGASGQTVIVEASTNLVNWQPIWTNTLSGTSTNFFDSQWTNYPERFYRVTSAFTVGGTLTGLPAGDTVTLQDNGFDNLTLSTNGTFTFPTALPEGHAYSVTVSGTSGLHVNPTLTYGSGTISGANVTNVAVECTRCPAFTGNMDLDMYNAAVSDGTANGGVPAVMVTTFGGPFRVTARGFCSDGVAAAYSTQCKVATIVGTISCSSTILPTGTVVIQFGGALVCGPGPFGY